MPSKRDPHEPSTVEVLKEAFESGRSVTLHIPDREAPLTGCVSHIFEGRVAGDYVLSAFVGKERVVIAAKELWNSSSSAAAQVLESPCVQPT